MTLAALLGGNLLSVCLLRLWIRYSNIRARRHRLNGLLHRPVSLPQKIDVYYENSKKKKEGQKSRVNEDANAHRFCCKQKTSSVMSLYASPLQRTFFFFFFFFRVSFRLSSTIFFSSLQTLYPFSVSSRIISAAFPANVCGSYAHDSRPHEIPDSSQHPLWLAIRDLRRGSSASRRS